MKPIHWFVLGLIVALCASLLYTCNTSNQVVKLQSDNETLHVANQNLMNDVRVRESKVDTLYIEKEKVRTQYRDKIKYIETLVPEQIDSAFEATYPNKDSAVKTYYHCLEARTQLSLSDSIIAEKDTIILSLKTISLNKDTIITNKDKQISLEKKNTTKWKIISAVGWLLNLAH